MSLRRAAAYAPCRPRASRRPASSTDSVCRSAGSACFVGEGVLVGLLQGNGARFMRLRSTMFIAQPVAECNFHRCLVFRTGRQPCKDCTRLLTTFLSSGGKNAGRSEWLQPVVVVAVGQLVGGGQGIVAAPGQSQWRVYLSRITRHPDGQTPGAADHLPSRSALILLAAVTFHDRSSMLHCPRINAWSARHETTVYRRHL